MKSTHGNDLSPSDDSYDDVTPQPGGDPATGTRRGGPEPEETIEFVREDDPNPNLSASRTHQGTDGWDPNDDDEEEDEDDGEERSAGSSVFSLAYEGIDPDALANLTDVDNLCMVKMSRAVGGNRVPCVCGRPRDSCSRKEHRNKRNANLAGTIGEGGFYEPLPGATWMDGRLDKRWYSTEEMESFEVLRRQEKEATARILEPELDKANDRDEGARDRTVSFGGSVYHGGSPAPAPEPVFAPSGVPKPPENIPKRPPVKAPPTPKEEPTSFASGSIPPDPVGSGIVLWYCMVRPTTQRVATNQLDKVLLWQAQGTKLVQVLRTRDEAEAWVKAWRPPAPTVTDIFGELPAGAPLPATLLPSGPSGGPNNPVDLFTRPTSAVTGAGRTHSDHLTSLLDKASRFATGPDPSTGTTMIFGTDPTDTDKMDELLLPPNIEDAATRTEFYDLAMDVANLPGGYRTADDDDYGSTELLARAFGRTRTGVFRNWRKHSHNALARIKSQKELLQFVRDVEKAVDRHRAAQEQRMRTFLYASRVAPEVIGLYLRSGLLPRIINETYQYYKGLLETCRSAQWEMPGATWKDGYVDQMIQHHATELGQIRQTAADYRSHLLETYVYLRNSNKEKYQDPTFTRALLYSVAKSHGGGTSDSERASESTGGIQSASRCKHCRRKDTHQGTDKEDCPLKSLSARKAQAAVANLNKNQAKAVAKKIKELLAADPGGDVDALLETARASV